jgi:spore germination protein GerM
MSNPRKKDVETEEQRMYRETVERIAGNIASLAKAVSALLNGPLKKRAIVKLLAASAGQSERVVEDVLKALESLESEWLNKR